MKHKLLLLSIIPCLLGFVFSSSANDSKIAAGTEVNSSNGGDRLKSFYERFEKSDLNKDGILTVDEMHSFLDKQIKKGTVSDPKPTKTVNLKKIRGVKSRAYLNAFYIETKGGCDTDGNGVLTKMELLDYVMSQKKIYNAKGEKVPHPDVVKKMETASVSQR